MKKILAENETKNIESIINIYSGVVVMVLSYAVFFIFDKKTAYRLGTEDGLFEYLGAVFFLLSSCVFAKSFIKHKKWIFLLLALMFFVAAGEEISWGQRIFNIEVPESIKEKNVLGALNFHNLKYFNRENFAGERKSFVELMFNIDRLFSVFWLIWCFVFPLLNKFNISINNWIKRYSIQIPLVSFNIGCLFVTNYLVAKILQRIFSIEYMWPITETKEWIFAFLFFIVSVQFVNRNTNDLF